jgi:rod shape-determining protein MreC
MNRQSSQALLALTLIILTLGLLVLDTAGYLDPVKGLAMRPVGGIQSWLAPRVYALRDMITSPRDIATLQRRIAELEGENAQLQQEIVTLREQIAEAEVLAALLDYARTQPQNLYLASTVISQGASPFLRTVWIGDGSEAGVVRGMPVVTQRGLVGRVIEVFPTVARIQLITDPQAAVNVRLQTSRADGTLVAALNGELRVELIEQGAVVTPGELILTSGLGGAFPADIPIGQVISVRQRDYDLFQEAVIQPSVDFSELEIVLVITNFSPLPVEATRP